MSAMGRADNAVSDSSEVSSAATPDKVSGLTLASCFCITHVPMLSKVGAAVSQGTSAQPSSKCSNVYCKGLKL